MLNSSHRICRLRYLVSTSSQTEAFAIRKSLQDCWQDSLLPVFEREFDGIARGDRTIHIPKLELQLKVTSEQELMEVLPELIQEQLKEQLQSITWETIPTAQPGVIWQEATAQQNQFATLIHYLQTGSVPWQVAYAKASTIAAQLKETCHQQRSQLINYLSNKPETVSFYFRLLQLLPEAEYFVLVNALSDKFLPEWRTAITEFIRFVLYSQNHSLNQPTQWQLVAATLSECSSHSEQRLRSNLSRILAKIIAEAGSGPQSGSLRDRSTFFSSLPATVSLLFQPQFSDDSPSTTAANLLTIESQEISAAGQYLDRNNYPEISNEVKELPVNSNLNPDSLSLPQLSDSSLSTTTINLPTIENQEISAAGQYLDRNNYPEIPNDEPSHQETVLSDHLLNPLVEIASTGDELPLSVNYAGLVLLHPFISPFFEATGVKETDSKTIAPSQMTRAAALLHFLATGQEDVYEYELGLIKILLGLEPETPLLVGAGLLQEGDRQEAETLLQSVINYWSVLKNTSINGLRSSFLQRSGLLRKTENGWSLQVEHQSFDMLLEHLPWSISIIKLSWMEQPLYTEWQTF